MKTLLLILLGLLILGVGILVYTKVYLPESPQEQYRFTSPEIGPTYQGPIQPGIDEDHFRKTGESSKIRIEIQPCQKTIVDGEVFTNGAC